MTVVLKNVTKGVKADKAACSHSVGLLWTGPLFLLTVKLYR